MNEVFKALSPKLSLKTEQDYVDTIEKIEKLLIHTYKRENYAERKWNLYEERRSLIVASLYSQILKQKDLPTVEAFVEKYLEENAHLLDQKAERFFANLGYLSLVTDLHFYFVLKVSCLFDEVKIDYEFDLTSYTDIILTLGNQTLGLQLFAGSEQSYVGKLLQLKLDEGIRSYPIYLFSRKSKKGCRKTLTTDKGQQIELYSYDDALYWSDFLANQRAQTMEQYEEAILNERCDVYSYAQNIEASKPKDQLFQLSNTTKQLLKRAEHSILIIGENAVTGVTDEFRKATKANGIALYLYDIPENLVPSIFQQNRIVVDGMLNNQPMTKEMYDELKKAFKHSSCNILQYQVEHLNPTSDIIVAAGAGSGKTHTLVSRALYLVNTGKVKSMKEIAMITFTNETADKMREKLANRILNLLQETGDLKYVQYLEDLQEMQISTIPAFAKSILSQFGQFIGLGTQIHISNLTMQRREIIEKKLDKHVQKNNELSHLGKLPHYMLINFIEHIWEKIEQKGLSPKDFKKDNEQQLFKLLLDTLQDADFEFSQRKLEKNTVTLADLTRYLKKLLEEKVSLVRLKNKYSYLFVDEFQDTDNAQIDFIVEVAKQAQIPLLVVGDIKQSIYRFRGANATAFEEAKKALQQIESRTINEVELRYNYRTTETLLSQLEALFNCWRQGNWLPKADLEMIASRKNAYFKGKEAFNIFYKSFAKEDISLYYKTLKHLKKSYQTPPTLAILVRRNREALAVGELLSQLKKEESIIFDVQLEGTLFQSLAAKDLLLLLESWIAPTDSPTLYAFQETAFCRGAVKRAHVKYEQGHYVLNQQPEVHFPKAWYEAIEQLKFNPTMLVLNDFLSKVPYMDNLAIDGAESFECIKYQLNLYKVIMLIYSSLEENTDLLALYEWLSLQVATNRQEDEAELDANQFDEPLIKVMTVHKSKGLEFHTVIIPYTQNMFIRQSPSMKDGQVDFNMNPFKDKNGNGKVQTYEDILVQVDEGEAQLAWLFANSKSGFSTTTNQYTVLKSKEDDEAAKEEARTLYVALTRAEERCFVYGVRSSDCQSIMSKPQSWANLLAMEKNK